MDDERRWALMDRAASVLDEVPEWIWDGESLPVPIEAIAEDHFGCLVRIEEDLSVAPGVPNGAALSGLLLVASREIWVSAQEARDVPRRKRYTIAHELGHLVLHAELHSVHCRGEEIAAAPSDVLLDEGEDIEAEANVFGGALLMPPRLLRRRHEESGGDMRALCRLFDLSWSAFEGRAGHHLRYALRRWLGEP